MDLHVRRVILHSLVRPKQLYLRSHYVTTVENSGTIFDRCSKFTEYSDDVVIVERRVQDVEEVFTLLVKQTNKMGIEINEKNTIYDTIAKILP